MWGLSIEDMLALKKRGHYRIEAVRGRLVITVRRPGEPIERILCASPGHAKQVRQSLTDEGLCGFVTGAP